MNSSSMIASLGENSRRYEAELRRFQLELSNAHEQELRLQQQIAGVFPQIANLQLAGGARLSDEVQRLLGQRERTESGLREELAVAEAGVAKHLQEMSRVSQEIEALVADVNRQLRVEPAYQQQAAILAEAVERCNEAAASYQELRDECRGKLRVFQTEPLYLYLKGRGFGTDRYVGRTFFRELDRWIARLCNFPQNSGVEQSLLAMQEANEGAQWQRDSHRAVQEAELARLYQEALAGTLLSVLQARLKTEREAVEAGKAQANAVHERLGLFVSKGDEHFAQVAELLSRQLAEMSDAKLEHLAGQTATQQDDELVQRVRDLRAELDDLRLRVPFLEMKCRDTERDYARAKQLERDLQSGGYISSSYSYSAGMNLDSLVAGFMQGALSLSQVANEVGSHRRASRPAPSLWSSGSSSGSSGSSSNSSSSRPSSSSSNSSSSSSSFSSSRSTGGGGFSTSDSL
ncbi:hypothetical protein PUP68_09070 [Pseudomonas chlororaphis]|uniref:hypothetical protein n=1 Tax=Pseudomonas chlororaphis TaxID=587753 RepID=UPI0006A65002|nr:hypothetical protein [Pseudomonas chlororaphis]AZC29546.1 hypothetical protein C4K38_1571 [Pseudomonas chlororaphis subsp. piscium]WDG79709.1 hypothetical protein PUP77_03170 [Pseudomonas chlororaphis]WDG87239.1 hypothetical protein PUP68_09070 [Pseudomonas chlororaphis]WDG93505.1 hypothetical protein PUP49_08810 [Pseudomonas chlororaphis]SDT35364.1 hypothetical protein SAMN05216585_5802 [Pseudomonas chlororaphis]